MYSTKYSQINSHKIELQIEPLFELKIGLEIRNEIELKVELKFKV